MANIHVIIPEPSTGGGASAAFTTIQTPAGTYPLATGSTDTLTLAAGSAAISITGDSTTDTVTFDIASTVALWNANKLQGRTVSSAAPASGDVLTWNSGSSQWEPAAPSGGGGGGGDVSSSVGSSTNLSIAIADGTTGKLIKFAGATIATNNQLWAPNATYTSSMAIGQNNTVNGVTTHIFGSSCAIGQWSAVLGYNIQGSTNQRCVGIGHTMTLSGTGAIGIGYNVSNVAQSSVSIGINSYSTATLSVVIGGGAYAAGGGGAASNVVIGSGAKASSTTAIGCTAIGYNSEVSGASGTAIGYLSVCSGSYAFALGPATNVSANYGVAIGAGATVAHQGSVAIGQGATSTGLNQLVFGGYAAGAGGFTRIYMGTGVTNTVTYDLEMQNTSASGTNIAGKNLTINAAQGTGTGAGGHLKFRTAPAGSSGSALNILVDMLEINDTYAIIQRAHTSAPADADLFNGSCSFYLDESGNNLMVKVKYSGGTVKTGTVCAVA